MKLQNKWPEGGIAVLQEFLGDSLRTVHLLSVLLPGSLSRLRNNLEQDRQTDREKRKWGEGSETLDISREI
jgi:hypothetical protein